MVYIMIVKEELQKLIQSLLNKETSQISINGSDVNVRVVDDGAKLMLMTLVYTGGNYLPASVRQSIQQKPPFSSSLMQTNLIVNEERFEIYLRFVGSTDGLNIDAMRTLLEEFTWLADEWRLFLDEQDRNDRVRVPVQ